MMKGISQAQAWPSARVSGALKALACFSVALPAFGADNDIGVNPVPVESGPRAMALGNAFTAIADDASANAWNPAGMSVIERPELSLSAGWYHSSYDGGGGESSSELKLDHAALVMPFTIAGVPQSLGLAWQREYDYGAAFSLAFDDTTTDDSGGVAIDQRRIAYDQDGQLTSLNLSYAIEPHPAVAFGATVGSWRHDITGASDHSRTVSTGGSVATQQTSPFFDIATTTDFDERERIETEVTDGYHLTLGTMFRPSAAFTAALTVRPAFTLDFHDRRSNEASNLITTELTSFGSTTTDSTLNEFSESDESSWSLQLPTRVRLGLAYRFDDRRTLSCDLGWTRWQEYERRQSDGVKSSPLSPFLSADDQDDGFTLHAGYEHIQIHPRFVLVWRGGASIGQVPGLKPAISVDQPETVELDMDLEYTVAAGIGVFRRHVLTDLALQYRVIQGAGTGTATAIDAETDLRQFVVRLGVTVHM